MDARDRAAFMKILDPLLPEGLEVQIDGMSEDQLIDLIVDLRRIKQEGEPVREDVVLAELGNQKGDQ
jgi:hypothetical protein